MDLAEGCGYINTRHTALCSRVTGMRDRFATLLTALQTEIAALIAIPQAQIDAVLTTLSNADTGIDDTLPDDLKTLMEQECFRPLIPPSVQDRIEEFDNVTDLPAVLVGKLLKSVKQGLVDTSRNALGAILAGVAAEHVSEYNEFIQRSGLAAVLDALDYTYQCLVSICGQAGTTDCADDLRTLLNLRSNNTFDTTIFGTWNPNAPAVAQLNQVKDALDVKETIIDAISF